MVLDLIEKQRQGDGRYSWISFEPNDEFDSGWWDGLREYFDGHRYFEARLEGVEVARLELIEEVDFEHYNVSDLDAALRIHLIEVAKSHRRRGIGREVVKRLTAMFPGRRLVALSEADDFWASLGWERHDHPDGPDSCEPLFVQPRSLADRPS
jgi:GNAT superfamily N-acetyltransferase